EPPGTAHPSSAGRAPDRCTVRTGGGQIWRVVVSELRPPQGSDEEHAQYRHLHARLRYLSKAEERGSLSDDETFELRRLLDEFEVLVDRLSADPDTDHS